MRHWSLKSTNYRTRINVFNTCADDDPHVAMLLEERTGEHGPRGVVQHSNNVDVVHVSTSLTCIAQQVDDIFTHDT